MLDVEGVSNLDGAKIMQYADWGGENQRFHFVPLDGGFYKVIIRKSMKCWNVPGSTFNPGNPVVQMAWDTTDNAVWEIIPFTTSLPGLRSESKLNVFYSMNQLHIKPVGNSRLSEVFVVNMLGETVSHKYCSGNSEFSFAADLAPGLYIVKAIMEGGLIANRKFVKH